MVGDAEWRWYYGTGAEGWGLHGGTYRYSGPATAVRVTLRAVRWTADTAVSGHATWDQVPGLMRAWLTVTGPQGTAAAVRLHYLDYRPHPVAEISGTFHGRPIVAVLPAP